MEAILLSRRLLDSLDQYKTIDEQTRRKLAAESINVIGNFIYSVDVPDTWFLRDIKRTDSGELIFYWQVNAEQAACSHCGTVSHSSISAYHERTIQDLPICGQTVYHKVIVTRYSCINPDCQVRTFYEQFPQIADRDCQLSHRLKDLAVRIALESSCNSTVQTLASIGAKISGDSIERELKSKGALIVADNLKRDGVKILAIDDINQRKGDPSTACTVYIDGETHQVLVITKGATAKNAGRVMRQFPSVTIVSRDRDTAYASAAEKNGKIQVADSFHLVQNIHRAVKNALGLELGRDVYIREGSSWVRMVDSSCEAADPETASLDDGKGILFIGPARLDEQDRERRIALADLKDRQAEKYRKTLAVLELTESGLRTGDIARKLGMSKASVMSYRTTAPETIETTEQKIDAFYQKQQEPEPVPVEGQALYRQKTIARNAKPTAESIVEPYRELVLKLYDEGKSHRAIYPVLVQQGFTGSANAVYQFIIKYLHENHQPVIRNTDRNRQKTDREQWAQQPRPPRISIERIAMNTVYAKILHRVAEKREAIRQSLQGLDAKTGKLNVKDKESSETWVNKTYYKDSVAKIIFNPEKKTQNVKKKLKEEVFDRLVQIQPCVEHFLTFLLAFHAVFLSRDEAQLMRFIASYQRDEQEELANFAGGLLKDLDAVKNALIYPHVSNGPIEGVNNKIKMIKRRTYGRAGLELLNALLVLPGYYTKQAADRLTELNTEAIA